MLSFRVHVKLYYRIVSRTQQGTRIHEHTRSIH